MNSGPGFSVNKWNHLISFSFNTGKPYSAKLQIWRLVGNYKWSKLIILCNRTLLLALINQQAI
jgi:hypothetical protein